MTVQGATGQLWSGNNHYLPTLSTYLPTAMTAIFSWNNASQQFNFWFRGFPDGFQTLPGIQPGNFYFFQTPGESPSRWTDPTPRPNP